MLFFEFWTFFHILELFLYQCEMFNHEIYPHPESINFYATWHSWTKKKSWNRSIRCIHFCFYCLFLLSVSSNQILTYYITFSPYKSKHLLCNNFISIVKFFFVKLEFYYTNERCASTTCIYLLLILIQQCTSNHKQHLYHDDEVFL